MPERIRSSRALVRQLQEEELFLAEQVLPDLTLGPDSGCCVLGPHKSNIHRIESVGGTAAFLDILAPPYNIDPPAYAEDRQERDCHYFRVLSESGGEPGQRWLLTSHPPASFFCDTEAYMGPSLGDEAD